MTPLVKMNTAHCIAGFLFFAFGMFYTGSAAADVKAHTAIKSDFSRSCRLPDEQTLQPVIRIINQKVGKSSGVVIAPNRVLTVLHALDFDSKNYAVIGGNAIPAEAVAINEEQDLVLLETHTGSIAPVTLSERRLAIEESIWAIGYPLGGKRRTSLGVVTAADEQSIYSSAHINSGTSGGALLRCSGLAANQFELAGIVRAYLADTSSGVPVNIGDSVAISHQVIRRMLDSATKPSLAMLSQHSR